MGYDIAPELQKTLLTLRTFVNEELIPLEKEFLHRPFAEVLPLIKEKQARVKKMGLLTPHMPKEVGGAGFHFLQFARIAEELGRTPLGLLTFNSQAPDAGNMGYHGRSTCYPRHPHQGRR